MGPSKARFYSRSRLTNFRVAEFQSALRAALTYGVTPAPAANESSLVFQSAPRAHARGDYGPANRQRRNSLLPHLREHNDPCGMRSDSIVKEQ